MLPLSLFDGAAAAAPAAVPPPAPAVAAVPAAAAAPVAAPLAAGARVMARHGGKAPWYAGKVAAVRADGSFDIAYDDGDKEEAVPPHLVRPAAAPAATDASADASADAAPSQRRFVSRGLNTGVSTSPRSANLASAVLRGKLLTLHTHGWVVLPVGHGGHVVDEAVLSTIRASRFEPIFNGQPAGEPPQRHQGTRRRSPPSTPVPNRRAPPPPPSPHPHPHSQQHPARSSQGVRGSGPSR